MRRDLEGVARELRNARLRAGLTLRESAVAAGVSYATTLRAETGLRQEKRLMILARHASAVGMRIRVSAYPGDDPVQDAGQVRLIRRFRDRIGDVGSWQFEVPIPHPYDQRAVDAVLTLPAGRIGLEFSTRLADAQAQLRAANLKKRDAGLDRMIVVVQATHRNRLALREAGDALDALPGATRGVLAALKAGVMPDADGVVLL
jgi:hypothetical protein